MSSINKNTKKAIKSRMRVPRNSKIKATTKTEMQNTNYERENNSFF